MAYKKNKDKPAVPATEAKVKMPGQHKVAGRFSLQLKLTVLLGVISFIVYANTLGNKFALDDAVMIVNNKFVTKGVAAIPELFATPHQRGFWEIPNDEYRPLPLGLFAIEYQVSGGNPMPFHFMNILLFAGCVVLLFRFLDKLFDGKRTAVAFIASLLFALHPVHTEVVANIKSGDELMCFFFAFMGMNVFMRYVQSGRMWQLLSGFLFIFLSYLSKETVVTFLAILPLVFYFFINENRRRSTYVAGSAVLATVLFLVIRVSVLNHYHANNVTNINIIENALAKSGLSFESRMATAVLILGKYIKLLFVPYPLISEYSFNTIPYVHFSNPLVLVSLFVYGALLIYGIMRFLKDRKDPYAFGILFFLITIALFSNIFVLIKSTMGERFLFFPSVGFCLVAALLIERWLGNAAATGMTLLKQPKVLGLIIPLSLLYGAIVIDRNTDWMDNYTMYRTDTKKVPNNSHLNYLLGYELFSMAKQERNATTQQQMIEDAITYMRRSVNILPEYYYANTDLGAAFFFKGQFDSAEVYDLAALKLFPDAVVSRNNLSGVYLKSKQFRKAIDVCRKSIELSPTNIFAYADLGFSFYNLKIYDSAVYHLKKGISADPNFYGNYDVLSYVYRDMGITDSMQKYQAIAKQLYTEANRNNN